MVRPVGRRSLISVASALLAVHRELAGLVSNSHAVPAVYSFLCLKVKSLPLTLCYTDGQTNKCNLIYKMLMLPIYGANIIIIHDKKVNHDQLHNYYALSTKLPVQCAQHFYYNTIIIVMIVSVVDTS